MRKTTEMNDKKTVSQIDTQTKQQQKQHKCIKIVWCHEFKVVAHSDDQKWYETTKKAHTQAE